MKLFAAVAMMAALAACEKEGKTEQSGQFGALAWKLTKDGALTVTGTGEMDDAGYQMFPWDAFKDQIKSLTVGQGVVHIGHSAFDDCPNLTNVKLPEGLTSIGGLAFEDCIGLTNIDIPKSTLSIADGAFRGCSSLKSIVIPDGVTEIHNGMCSGCTALSSVTLGEGVTKIVAGAFLDCSALTSITIPKNVTVMGNIWNNVGHSPFAGCNALMTVTAMPTVPPEIHGGDFGAPGATLRVPKGCLDAYKYSDWGVRFANIVEQ